ncbi:MAG TPA: hypothetical protein VF850_01025 [Gemmatimonadaceae bacterium]
MTEDNFEEFLKRAAQGYNAPPARTPREDMWSAIQAQRAAGPRVVYGGGLPMRETSGRRFGSRIWMGAAAAAVLFLAIGVGIGRWSAKSNSAGSVAAGNPSKIGSTLASTGEPSATTAPDGGTSQPNKTSGELRTVASPGSVRGRDGQRPEVIRGRETQVAIQPPSANSTSASAYQLAAVRHLSEAEALLTSFRTRSNADQQMDAQLGSWARELLSNTRLLLDSPVANDPQRRPLLEDLELVLVQIVQLSPGSTPQDRELIEKTLQHDHVMTRLRTAIPAGSQRGS